MQLPKLPISSQYPHLESRMAEKDSSSLWRYLGLIFEFRGTRFVSKQKSKRGQHFSPCIALHLGTFELCALNSEFTYFVDQ